mmetsp:Transcript_22913/g.52513  ORF Transcript_22913/g.52513 Transcript_22913/m.52513 type:complete len:212 (+) Transcript_22913:103-738(+)
MLTTRPLTSPLHALVVHIGSHPILRSIPELPRVVSSIWPRENTMTFFDIVSILAIIGTTITPSKQPSAMHSSMCPLASKRTLVAPPVGSLTMDLIVHNLSFVRGSIWPIERSNTMLVAINILTFESGSIWEGLKALAKLYIRAELPTVLCAILVQILSVSFGLVIAPQAMVDVTASMIKPTLALDSISDPLSFISSSIRPCLHAMSMPIIA